jgi:glycosyltransferase involved in cell wall biosynthesis
MAAGLPVAATPVGGIPDFLIDNETGFLTPIHNPEALANRLAFVLDPANQALVERVAHRAKSLVEEKYDWARIALRFDALFKRLAV